MITTLFEFFALGTLGFWILISLISITFVACIENDHYTFPTILALAIGTIYWKPLMAFVNWQSLAIGVLVYVVVGVLWSVFRWFRYVKDLTNKYKKNPSESALSTLKYALDVSDNKSRITAWIAYWPWSLLWNIIGDLCVTVYEQIEGVYQKITDKALGNLPELEEKSKR